MVTNVAFDESTEDITKELYSAGKIFDNGDKEINLDTLEEMVDDGKYATHWTKGAWCGHVFPVKTGETVKFREQVKQGGNIVGLYEADTLEELFSHVNTIYGWD
jgi:hypothetical protein